MHRWFFLPFLLLSFLFASSNYLSASDWLYTITETETPFDCKYIHANGSRECYLTFSRYNENIDKETLFAEAHDSISARYGEKFWKKMNFSHLSMKNDSDNMMLWSFSWHTDDQVENVLISVFKDSFTEQNCCCSVFLIDKGRKDDFNRESSYESLSEDMQAFIVSIFQESLNP